MAGTFVVFNFGGRENTYAEHTLDQPTVDAQRAMAAAYRDLIQSVLAIKRADDRADEAPSKGLLERLVDSIEEMDQ